MSPCRVVIADDMEPTRKLYRAIVEAHPRITVVCEAGNGIEALAAVRDHRPDVLLLDLSMPEMDGLQVLLALQAEPAPTRVVVLSGFARDRLKPIVIESGAVAYLEKGVAPEVLTRAVLDACDRSVA